MRNRNDIEKYLRGELSSAEMHALEKEALSDPFLAEALEGVEQTGADNFLYDLHQLNRSVHDRMRRKGRKNGKVIRLWGWTAAVAATLLLLIVSGFIAVTLLRDQHARDQAVNRPQTPPADTATTSPEPLATESLPVKPDSSPLAAAAKKKPAPGSSTTLQRDSHTQPAIADAGPESDEVDARQEVTPAQEFIADEELSRNATGGEDKEAKNVSHDIAVPSEPAIARAPKEDEREVSQALKGRVAGVETNDVKKKSAAQRSMAATTVVKGKVRSGDGLGLPGVNVMVEGTNNGTITDSEGNFQLTVPSEDTRLHFAFIGFESQVVDVPERAQLDVTLKEDVTSLSEVVVTGYSGEGTSEESEPYRFAEPDGGRADFKKYLAGAVKYPVQAITNKVEGRVTVRFAVEATGQLTDFDIVKGIGSGCEEELIRAIRQGPAWKPSKRGTQPVRDKVSVRYRFKLPE